MQSLLRLVVMTVFFLVSANVFAEICIEVDTTRDNLEESERTAVRALIEEALRQQGYDVVQAPCAEMYTIFSIKLGNSVTATASGLGDVQSRKADSIEELPNIYRELLEAILRGEVTDDDAYQGNEEAVRYRDPSAIRHSLVFARGSVGLTRGEGGSVSGLGYGFGWRYRFEERGFEISIINLMVDGDGFGQASAVRVGGLYYFSPNEIGSGYMNAGLSYGASQIGVFLGEGFHGEIGFGYEFARASIFRGFFELNAVFPLYTAESQLPLSFGGEVYLTTFEVSLGFGF